MKNKNLQFIQFPLWIIGILFLLVGCDSFTDVSLPKSQLTASAVFEDRTTANAAMTDIYSKMRDNGLVTGSPGGLSNQLGLYADELSFYGQPGGITYSFAYNSLLPTAGEVVELWNSSYSQIYAANVVIEGVQYSTNLNQDDRNQLTGEALFVRALIHFYLANTFGAVPYIKTTDYEQNRVVRRVSENDVLAFVKADLENAIALLPENYISDERVRPNKYAAYALLARVCLYMQLWDEASDAASAVLNQNGLYIWENDLDKIFLKGSTTTIWQLFPGMSGDNTKEAETFSFFTGPPPNSALSPYLLGAFEPNDERKVHWINTVDDGADVYAHAFKYKQPSNTGSSVEYSIILRLAEQYLIRAESRAQQGDLIGAKEDLNIIRQNAGLPDTEAGTAPAIVEAVIKERQVELFCELGHRFFDLRRNNKLDEVLDGIKPGWSSTDRLFPIPQSELLLNPNLSPQNAGY